ncbi:Hypothetical predicted protein [Podarcis lilfordi]|uniref:Uncharacterized protein n=1 Tax=Podarcis lilfordi TaxID=74358 RepID=A0AA35PN23_9SAUR|nr:Hypothetical predicted protein [Podarcis lilfordi]
MALWALGLLMNSSLWGISGVQRPRWYYGGMDFPFGVTLATSPTMLGFPFSPQPLLYYCYWVIIGILAITTISAIVHFTKQFLRAQKQDKREPSQQGDPEEKALVEVLHLLDAVMETMWHHQLRLERRQRAAKASS